MNQNPIPSPANDISQKMAFVNYCLYLASFFTGGLTCFIALIIAYIYRQDARGTYIESHFTYQIWTFWLSLLYAFISGILTLVIIGFLLALVTSIWFIIRCVKGLKELNAQRPIQDPKTWLF